jgi:hypothetical protein
MHQLLHRAVELGGMMCIACASISFILCVHMSAQIKPEICETQDQDPP